VPEPSAAIVQQISKKAEKTKSHAQPGPEEVLDQKKIAKLTIRTIRVKTHLRTSADGTDSV
jgi:hypothetical protein